MNSKRLHLVLIGVIVLLFAGLIGGTYELNSTMTKKGASLTALKAKTAALQQEQLGLKKAKKEIAAYSDLEKVTEAIVPQDKSQAEAVREIINIADANSVHFSSISFPASTLGVSATPGKATTSASATAVNPAANANAKTNTLSQLEAVKNIPGVYLLPITIVSDPKQPVAYDKLINFLHGLEQNRRTAQVSAITIEPNKDNHSLLSFTITVNEYIKP
jgi:Tfp pilus assembly protein PilN